jgi:RNA polymerase sigma factor (TIGR02999 family)
LRKHTKETVIRLQEGFGMAYGSGSGDPSVVHGEKLGLDHLFSAAYEELRRLAHSVRRSDPNATLSPTALVNEAWLKLADSPSLASTSRLHFKRIAARAMRQVLIEAARRRQARKRGVRERSS